MPGLAGLHVGPTDLGLALGVGADQTAPSYRSAISAIVATGHANGLPVTMHAVAANRAAHWVGLGFDELVLTADIEVLRGAFADLLSGARAAIAGGQASPQPATRGAYGQTS